ncbi:hypothetical protein CP10139811_1068B, partial [Chlamydia ibidis]
PCLALPLLTLLSLPLP